MGIRPDDDLTGSNQAFVRQQGVLNAHATHFKIVGNIMLSCKIPHLFAQGSGFNILAGRKMIRHQRDFIFVKNRTPNLFKLIDGRRSCNIVRQYQVHLGNQQVAGFHKVPAYMHGQDFLCHCHAHKKFLLIIKKFNNSINKKRPCLLCRQGRINSRYHPDLSLIGFRLFAAGRLTHADGACYFIHRHSSRMRWSLAGKSSHQPLFL